MAETLADKFLRFAGENDERFFIYDHADIDAVTDGHVNSALLRAWIEQERLTKAMLPKASKGKRSLYNIFTVYEVALISGFARSGVRLDVATEWTRFVMKQIQEGSRQACYGWSAVGAGLVAFDYRDNLSKLTAALGSRFSVLNVHALQGHVDETLKRRMDKPYSIEDDE